jgi:hypothetical protein
MDVTAQVYDAEATGPLRGLYDDIRATFRAPLVNWIFRTTAANYPAFLQYMWGQVKPIFETRAFGRAAVAYRDTVLSGADLPVYRREELGLAPAEYRELRGQLATFDVVAPRLATLFETVSRGLRGELDPTPDRTDEAATAPLPAWLDRDRGLEPTMTSVDAPEGTFGETVADLQAVHGLGDTLPSIYRCLAQWPDYLEITWPEVRAALESDAFDGSAAFAEIAGYVDDLPYRPRLSPPDLADAGFDDGTVEDLCGLFDAFNQGPEGTLLPAIHLHAATVGAAGHRGPV